MKIKMIVLGVNKMELQADYNSMHLRVCLFDLADSCFKGVKIRNQEGISW